jgi:hypothetical protein
MVMPPHLPLPLSTAPPLRLLHLCLGSTAAPLAVTALGAGLASAPPKRRVRTSRWRPLAAPRWGCRCQRPCPAPPPPVAVDWDCGCMP